MRRLLGLRTTSDWLQLKMVMIVEIITVERVVVRIQVELQMMSGEATV